MTGASDVAVRHVRASEWRQLRELRLRALASDPGAFASTVERESGFADERWRWWAMESETGETQRTFVVVDGREAWCGLALVRVCDGDRSVAMVFAMWVAPSLRGRGLAGRLCDACAEWARGVGLLRLRLEVVVGNDAAERAYRAAGFEVTGEQTWPGLGRMVRERVMVRAL